jgi:hypothetical protein
VGRRGVVALGAIGAAGVAGASVVAGSGNAAWAAPAIRAAFGAPLAAASTIPSGYRSVLAFEGLQWLADPLGGPSASAPAAITLSNVIEPAIVDQTAIPAGATIGMFAPYENFAFIHFDPAAMLAGATIDGTAPPAGALTLHPSANENSFTVAVTVPIPPGSVVRLPFVGSPATEDTTYEMALYASCELLDDNNYNPTEYDSHIVEYRTFAGDQDFGVRFDDEQVMNGDASGNSYTAPRRIVFSSGEDSPPGTLSPAVASGSVKGALVLVDEYLHPQYAASQDPGLDDAVTLLIGEPYVGGVLTPGAAAFSSDAYGRQGFEAGPIAQGVEVVIPVAGMTWDANSPQGYAFTIDAEDLDDLDTSNNAATFTGVPSRAGAAPDLTISYSGSTVVGDEMLPATMIVSNAIGAGTLAPGWGVGFDLLQVRIGQPKRNGVLMGIDGFVVNSLYYGTYAAVELAPGESVSFDVLWGQNGAPGSDVIGIVRTPRQQFSQPY